MRREFTAVLAAVATVTTVVAAGCADESSSSAASSSAASPEATARESVRTSSPLLPSSAAPSTNAQGRIPKDVGQVAGVGNSSDPSAFGLLTFVVTSIRTAPTCSLSGISTGSGTPQLGEVIFVGLEFNTAPDYATAMFDGSLARQYIDGMMNPTVFKSINPDGTVNGQLKSAYLCSEADTEGFSDDYDPASSYKGTLVFDALPGTKCIILPGRGQGGGWEWKIPDQ